MDQNNLIFRIWYCFDYFLITCLQIIFTNVGNPHALGQKPLTFPRQVHNNLISIFFRFSTLGATLIYIAKFINLNSLGCMCKAHYELVLNHENACCRWLLFAKLHFY